MVEVFDFFCIVVNVLECIKDCMFVKMQFYVDGVWIDVVDGMIFFVYDFVINVYLIDVVNFGYVEMLCVIDVVNVVWFVWCELIGKECVGLMCCWFDLLIVNVDDFVVLMIVE